MKASVVLPCYNGVRTLGVQLDALARQTFKGDWELIFVDNGSTDGSLALLETYRDRIPNIRILQAYDGTGPRRPVPNSYRLGFEASRGDVIIGCEADDEVADDYIEQLVKALERCDFAAPAIEYRKLNPPELVWDVPGTQTPEAGLSSVVGPLHIPIAILCGFGMTRRCYEKVGDPSEEIGAVWDADYCWRVHFAGFPITFVPEASMHYRVRVEGKSRWMQARTWGRSQLALLIRYGMPPWPRYLAYCLVRLADRSLLMLLGVIQKKRPVSYYVWDIAFAWGQLMAFPRLFMAQMRGAKRDEQIFAGARPTEGYFKRYRI